MSLTGKKSFKQGIEGLVRKATLCLAFTAALGGCSPIPAPKTVALSDTVNTLQAAPQDTKMADVFATTSNLNELSEKTPQIFNDLALMEKLPLTGEDTHCMLTDPSHRIISSLSSGLDTLGAVGWYSNDTLRVARGVGSSTTIHEFFHAAQDIRGSDRDLRKMSVKDAFFGFLLQEATAVAYELAVQREAANKGLQLTPPDSSKSQSIKPAHRLAFNLAYANAWWENADADSTTRTAQALSAGGKAVVRRLMNGKDTDWSGYYLALSVRNVDTLVPVWNSRKPGLREEIYAYLGAASSQVNFTPDEYLAAAAEENIDKCLSNMGIRIVPRTFTRTQIAQQTTP